MCVFNENEPRLIPLAEALPSLGVSERTFWNDPCRFPPYSQNGERGKILMLNYDAWAYALSRGEHRTHLAYETARLEAEKADQARQLEVA